MVGDEMVGTGKLMVEYKFSRGLSKVGHIEDIVVGKDYRGNGYGKMIVKYLIEQARKNGCYKVILNSDEDKVEFYNKCAKDLKINYDYGIKYYL
jgi:glucosamine-phosphate N-acetyltransferase